MEISHLVNGVLNLNGEKKMGDLNIAQNLTMVWMMKLWQSHSSTTQCVYLKCFSLMLLALTMHKTVGSCLNETNRVLIEVK